MGHCKKQHFIFGPLQQATNDMDCYLFLYQAHQGLHGLQDAVVQFKIPDEAQALL